MVRLWIELERHIGYYMDDDINHMIKDLARAMQALEWYTHASNMDNLRKEDYKKIYLDKVDFFKKKWLKEVS